MKQQYIVQVHINNAFNLTIYIGRVSSYKKKNYKVCLTQEYAHKYKSEKTANNAANRLNGKVILI